MNNLNKVLFYKYEFDVIFDSLNIKVQLFFNL